ncbi:uncharacterized protein At5g19025-like [Punica granatum]|uniref:Uncharacterized protein n=2 Tax=Punica granatum TaxID=22663 RepID=A0A2I0KKP5_PUNGR|nr:uncharacterized protein At5g19025-like [Punica granatum]PKI68753.1 hypothetical protein CRG98_010810 [Punica granatum]
MHHLFLLTMPALSSSKPLSSSSSTTNSPKSPNPNNPSSSSSSSLCKNSRSATLDVLILILVVFSGTFLVSSYFSYIFNSLSLLLSHPTIHLHVDLPIIPYAIGFPAFFAAAVLSFECLCGARSRRCHRAGCKGLKKAMEFDLQLQTEDCVKSGSKDIDRLPWKGGTETNPDYECLRAELRKMAPPNGRAVLLFRARCGCPIAKLEGWGPKKGRRHKKALANASPHRKGDHR